jgi:hypothetical protein
LILTKLIIIINISLIQCIANNKQLKLFNHSDLFSLNILKLNLFSFIRRNCIINIDKYINQIIPQQKLILNEIKPDIILPQVSIFRQKSLIRYISYNIGYQINEYILFICTDQDGKIVYDGKILLNDLNFRKILYNLLLNNVKHVLIVNNLLNWSTKIEKQELFDAKFISDLEDFLNASCITVIDYLIIVKNKVYSFKQQK